MVLFRPVYVTVKPPPALKESHSKDLHSKELKELHSKHSSTNSTKEIVSKEDGLNQKTEIATTSTSSKRGRQKKQSLKNQHSLDSSAIDKHEKQDKRSSLVQGQMSFSIHKLRLSSLDEQTIDEFNLLDNNQLDSNLLDNTNQSMTQLKSAGVITTSDQTRSIH